MTDHAETFWDRLEDVNAGMLGLTEDPRLVPMHHYADKDANVLWFITARQTDLATSVADGGKNAIYAVSTASEGLYARIQGTLSLSDDRAKLDELWNAVASTWFDKGEQDPDVQLMRLDLKEAEIWTTGGSVSFIYQMAKAKVTGKKPDAGDHFTLSF